MVGCVSGPLGGVRGPEPASSWLPLRDGERWVYQVERSWELRLGEERFHVGVTPEGIDIGRGNAPKPDAIIETDPATLRALVFGDRKLAGAPVEIGGDARIGRAFFRLFSRP